MLAIQQRRPSSQNSAVERAGHALAENGRSMPETPLHHTQLATMANTVKWSQHATFDVSPRSCDAHTQSLAAGLLPFLPCAFSHRLGSSLAGRGCAKGAGPHLQLLQGEARAPGGILPPVRSPPLPLYYRRPGMLLATALSLLSAGAQAMGRRWWRLKHLRAMLTHVFTPLPPQSLRPPRPSSHIPCVHRSSFGAGSPSAVRS